MFYLGVAAGEVQAGVWGVGGGQRDKHRTWMASENRRSNGLIWRCSGASNNGAADWSFVSLRRPHC